jgi:hypothetical protein
MYIEGVDDFTLPTDRFVSVRGLIAMHRWLGRSENRFLRGIGNLFAAGLLDRRLTELSDRQIGQLMVDEVGRDFGVFQPETAICQQATLRLLRSVNGAISRDDLESQRQHPPCPKCGNEMLFHCGIEEPDFCECVSLNCGHKLSIDNDRQEEGK